MLKIFINFIGIVVFALFAVSCGPSAAEKEATEKARQDSIRMADSLANVQRQIDDLKAQQQSAQDSIDNIPTVIEQTLRDAYAMAKGSQKNAVNTYCTSAFAKRCAPAINEYQAIFGSNDNDYGSTGETEVINSNVNYISIISIDGKNATAKVEVANDLNITDVETQRVTKSVDTVDFDINLENVDGKWKISEIKKDGWSVSNKRLP